MTTTFFLVRAVVAAPLRDKFDTWYSADHLPWAMRIFKCEKAWRFWSEVEPGMHYAVYRFADKAACDAALGAAAGLLFVVGLCRVFFFEKGAAYYFHSHAFMTKFSVFIAVALLSIIPTVEFMKWRKAPKAGQVPTVDGKKLRLVRKIIHGELAAVVIIVLCAAIMARGGWVQTPAAYSGRTEL